MDVIAESNQLAIEHYKKALEIQEDFVSSRFHLGLMYHRINNFHEALKCFSKVLLQCKDDKTVYIERGKVYQDMGNHPLAINDFYQAIELDPDLSEGYFRRGLSKFNSKNYNDAISDLKKADEKENLHVDSDPNHIRNAGIPDGLGQCYHALGQFEKAVLHYDIAIEMNPLNTQFLMHRA
jgi:tetratricopeptide (TPR) repeat protein